jgi:hypothetical protein
MTTTVDQSGRQLKIVNYTAMAYRRLQTSRTDWEWLRGTFSHALVINQASYTPAELGIATRFKSFAIDVPADGYRPMRVYERRDWRRGQPGPLPNQPRALRHGPRSRPADGNAPDRVCARAGQALRRLQARRRLHARRLLLESAAELAADADVPELPSHFHDLIVWGAIKLMSGLEGRSRTAPSRSANTAPCSASLRAEQVRSIDLGGPLA